MAQPKLLLVEDDPALAELVEFRFKAEGYGVLRTDDGDEALLLAAEEAPDVVILDWMIEGPLGKSGVSNWEYLGVATWRLVESLGS